MKNPFFNFINKGQGSNIRDWYFEDFQKEKRNQREAKRIKKGVNKNKSL